MSKPTIVVIGATGRQGGATVRALEATGKFTVVAVSRDPTSSEARAFHAQHPNVEIRRANCIDKASLVAAFRGAYGVFGVTNPFVGRWNGSGTANVDMDGEERQGLNLVDACLECNVQHFVFTSVASALEKTGVPTFDVKARVEAYLVKSRLQYTILAPVGFYENLESPFAGIKQGIVPGLLKETKAQMIATDDIGLFAAMAFTSPAEWAGRRLEIAGDCLSAQDMANTLSRLRHGEHWRVNVPPAWVFKLFIPRAVAQLKEFLEHKGTHVDIDSVRAILPTLKTWEQWAISRGYATKKFDRPGLCVVQ